MTREQRCLALQELQARRVAMIRTQIRLSNALGAMARRALGYDPTLPEKERAAIRRKADRMLSAMNKGKPVPEGTEAVAADLAMFVLAFKEASTPLDAQRKGIEAAMVEEARQLPAGEFVERTRGFGYLGLAIIVGEAGDLNAYPAPCNLWKRMGVAPPDAYAMETKNGKTVRAIPRRRRSALWTLGDSLIKGNDDGYRTLYLERKAFERERAPKLTKMHAHRRAQRYMEKRLLRDLWRAWTSSSAE